jgi:hypothetical protein
VAAGDEEIEEQTADLSGFHRLGNIPGPEP